MTKRLDRPRLEHQAVAAARIPPPAVLVVDDLPANLLALEVVIGELGYPVVLANSGSEALKRMLDTEFACVVLDLRMPGIDGLETAALIRKRERHRDLPIMFITSSDPTLAEQSEAYSLGAVDFIRRPLDPEFIKSKIRAVAQLYADRGAALQEREDELRRGRERLALLFDQLPIALWSTDENLTLTFCGGAFYGQGDMPRPEALIGSALADLLPARDGQEHPTLSAHRKALLGEARTYLEERCGRTYEGTLRPLRDAQGRVTGVLGAAVEVTQRRRSEEAVRDGQEKFDLLLGSLQDSSITFLDPAGRVEVWNDGAERINGYSTAEAIGLPFARFFTPEDQSAGRPAALLAEAARTGSVRDSGWRVRKDGVRFWADVLITALRRPDGVLRGYARIARDLTDRHKADEELRRLKDNLEAIVDTRTAALQETVEELKAFNHTISHDIRTPLRGLIGLSELLLEDYQGKVLDAAGQARLQGITETALRMDRMTQDLLDYARVSRDQITLAPLDVAAALAETLADMAADLAARKAVVQTDVLGGIARAHPLLVKHVLMNLLHNGIKFVAPGVAPVVKVRGEKRGGFIRVWIEDNGLGVAPENHARIFRIFERLHPREAYPGTGIGLAIVKRAVERMEGRLGIESEPGAGSRFWFELPLA
jgi:PAS domain S-box-containing protein